MKKLLPFLFLAMTSICRADSKTPRLGLTIPTIGSPTWGQKINGNFQILDATAIAGSIGLLAVGTGTANNFTTTITSITYGISFQGDQFSVTTDTNNRTAYITSLSSGGGGGGLVVTGTPQVNYEVVWNGSAAQWTAEGTSYSFSIATFADSLASTIEEGNGVWKSSGTINFTASYNNGPPIGSTITFSGWSPLPLASPFTSTTSIANVNFPSVGGTVVFSLLSQQGIVVDTKTITHIFNNDRYWGVTSLSGGIYTSTDVTSGFGNNDLINSIPKTFTVNPGAGQYIAYAYPSRLGTATFTVGGFAGGFLPSVTVSVTNGSGYVENFSVYRSVNSNLGSTTVVVTTP